MADRPDAYVRKDPGDIIRSGDWNEMQIRAREELHRHQHTGGGDGALIQGGSIADDAELAVKSLATSGNTTVNGDLKVNGKVILDGVDDLLARFKAMQSDTVSFAKDVSIGGSLSVQGSLIRNVQMATGLGPNDLTRNGQIASRKLNFNKRYAETAIRILYCDNFRVYAPDIIAHARWEIRIDGKPLPGSGAILQEKMDRGSVGFASFYYPQYPQFGGAITNNRGSGEHFAPAAMLGYATGISADAHVIGVWVTTTAGEVYTGYNNSRWTIEAEEVWL
jgi:hypothetical protein